MSSYPPADLKAMAEQARSSGDVAFAEALQAAAESSTSSEEGLDQILNELKDRGIGDG